LADAEAVAEIHAACFQVPWSADELASLLGQDPVFGFIAISSGSPEPPPGGFVLARLAAGEAEILAIAVRNALQGAGLGRMLMDGVLRHLHAERAEALFLEVDEGNAPALALYRRLGFRQVGQRPGYYDHPQAPKTAALTMRRDLR